MSTDPASRPTEPGPAVQSADAPATAAATPAWIVGLPPTLQPLREPVFRMLWLAWLAANMTMWMNDVAASWMMTQLTDSAVMVALVSTASTLPVFLLGLPSGALADIVDRRRWFAATQLWVASVGVLLALLALAGQLSPLLLLTLTFANGVGLAMRWPVFAAIVPDIISRDRLSGALALQGLAMNMSRLVGPVLAGALLAASGSAAVFALNAAFSLIAFVQILRWRSTPRASTLPGERFVGAMRVGLQHVRQSPRMKVVLLRVFLFFLQTSALNALLPLVAKQLGGGAGTYTALLSSMGFGAVTAAMTVPQLRERLTRDRIVMLGTLMVASMTALVAWVPNRWVAMLAMAVAGVGWISAANTLTLAAQLALPNWVRARGMATYQMALMGGSAAGAALWGQVTSIAGLTTSLLCAASLGPIVLWATRSLQFSHLPEEDFSPAQGQGVPPMRIEVEPDEGPVMVTVEYQIDLARTAEFHDIMIATRRARLRQGALSWGLFRDAAVPGRYIEYFVDESWVEHLRRHERFTAADVDLRERRAAFHTGDESPLVRRYVAEGLGT